MAGAMNDPCVPFLGLLTEHMLLGTPLPPELVRHLDRCPRCAREAPELGDVVRKLRRADPLPDRGGTRVPAPPARPSAEVGERVRRAVVAGRPAVRRPRRRIALGAAAVLAVAAAVLVSTSGQEPPPSTPVTLVREGKMVDRPWGTEVPVVLSGLPTGETYRMMTVDADGTRAPGGSVRVVSHEKVSTRMMTAMPKDAITALVVEDERGRVVTRVPVPPPSSPAAP
ncbi:hypothetical protein IHE55_03960 [Streptomyces pactum]|uniref:Zinc-finger domain-containing protein n=1 Tax=Streptomyces pactum TaxID=68249 RepID=A0ABS0NFQ2_9ACTN|nr:hypothetical protein [Streptomyces pactum]MBH5334002.1 hypothetical protein [Streptomyces pactum]